MLREGRGSHLVLARWGAAEGSSLLGRDSHSADKLAGEAGAETMKGQCGWSCTFDLSST